MRKRPASRLLIVDQKQRILLFHFVFDAGPLAGQKYWATPGGAVEAGESFPEAARREMLEETGIHRDVGTEVAQRDAVFQTPNGDYVTADERYFLVRTPSNTVSTDGQGHTERIYMKVHKWWSFHDLITTDETVFPDSLLDMLGTALEHRDL